MDLVIVESPAKAKTINKYLGSGAEVYASYGHVRDLPQKDGSVDPDNDFAMTWEVRGADTKRLSEITAAAKRADRIILATDPDREGEAISWHVLEILMNKKAVGDKPVQRVVFNAITRNAVLEAMEHPREIDRKLVDAYLARRALDYLVGFNLSPVLWRKLPGSRSAGRVQSVALRLICEREIEIEKFIPREYWSVDTLIATDSSDQLMTRLQLFNGEKVDKFSLASADDAARAEAAIRGASFSVHAVERKPGSRNPSPPFTTSTLQQEASRKLGFSASRTMQVAQRLYEGITIDGETTGLITYMRTDGLDLAAEAITEIRDQILQDYGADYLPEAAKRYTKTAANAQEAHEAIRPTSIARLPADLAPLLDDDQRRLYDLIWKRTISCQMSQARVERTTLDILSADGQTGLRASGTIITFMGFLAAYEEGQDEPADDKEDQRLPDLKEGQAITVKEVSPEQHFTEPPPRYSEATLVKRMEELGIGRPSTYASVLGVLREREYVVMDRNRFIPQDKGRLVVAFLENFFERYVEYDFTAGLETDLDRVSSGDLSYRDVLRRFWQDFKPAVDQTLELRNTDVLDRMNDVLGPYIFKDTGSGDPRKCPKCGDGQLSLKTGRYGAFIGCTLYPDCRFTRPFSGDEEQLSDVERLLGTDPDTGLEVHVKNGRFGAYIQLGEKSEELASPKRAGIPQGYSAADMTLEYALKFLSLPRSVGTHPETQDEISADIGRYGPYLRSGKQSASLENVEDVFTIGVNHAVTVLAEKKTSRGQRGPNKSVIQELGEHPDDGKPVRVMDGRFGPYVKHDKINATIPKDENPAEISMERALELVEARRAKGPAAKKKPASRKKKAKS